MSLRALNLSASLAKQAVRLNQQVTSQVRALNTWTPVRASSDKVFNVNDEDDLKVPWRPFFFGAVTEHVEDAEATFVSQMLKVMTSQN